MIIKVRREAVIRIRHNDLLHSLCMRWTV